jgi:hypothetical protein
MTAAARGRRRWLLSGDFGRFWLGQTIPSVVPSGDDLVAANGRVQASYSAATLVLIATAFNAPRDDQAGGRSTGRSSTGC